MLFHLSHHLRQWLVAGLLAGCAALVQAAGTSYTVTAPDGVSIAVQESGNPDGPAIVFIHGLLGSHLSWEAQTHSPLLQRYRLITYDLRGHGSSGKPERADAYTDGRRWADDLAAVLDASGAQRPVLVGWSLGAAVATNFMAIHGDQRMAGAMYVGGVVELQPELIVPHPQVYAGMDSADLKTHLDAERDFVALCFAMQPDVAVFQRLIGNAAVASEQMQKAVHGMSLHAEQGLGQMTKPLLLIYGERDALVQAVPSLQRAKALQPRAQHKLYPASGHAPFLEESERFNQDLAAFVDTVTAP